MLFGDELTLNEKDTTKTHSANWAEQIGKLIKLVDAECKKRTFTTQRKIGIIISVIVFVSIFALLAYMNLIVGVSILSYASTLPTEQEKGNFLVTQLPSYFAVTLSVVALILSYPRDFTRSSTVEELSESYYGVLSKKAEITADDRPYLKALINMKCSNFDLSLRETYENCVRINSDIFSQESLLKSLYQSK